METTFARLTPAQESLFLTLIGADLTSAGWLDGIPADRPAMIVADGLMAVITGEAYKTMTRGGNRVVRYTFSRARD